MGKIICDICGTSYPDTAQQCPICGCTREAAAQMLGEDFLQDEAENANLDRIAGTSSRKRKEIFDYDEVNADQDDYDDDNDNSFAEGDEYEETEQNDRPNTFAVIILTVLIAALLLAAGVLFFRYIRPNMNQKKAEKDAFVQQTAAQTTLSTAAESAIPCETLVLSSGNKAVLTEEGGRFLLHVSAHPSDTTDKIMFSSADESIATVSADGRIEAVSEGETVITISCGSKRIECQVVVKYSEEEETIPDSATTDNVASNGTTPSGDAVATEQSSMPTEGIVLKDINLRLKNKDIRLGVGYEFQLVLDCKLEQNEVEWSSEHPHIATVDENGVVKAIKGGTTEITAKYGDQEVHCIIRCFW